MAESKKYYYLKLKENFFDSDEIVLLEQMQDGEKYVNLLLKLYLKSLKNEGKLLLNSQIPLTVQMIATITRREVGTVERALRIFKELGFVDELTDGSLYMSNIQLLIGKSSTEAERKMRERKKLSAQKLLPGHFADICPPEIETESETEKKTEQEPPAPFPLGRYRNVSLSEVEFAELRIEFPLDLDKRIDRLSSYMTSTGKTYQSHAATIRRWAENDQKKPLAKQDYIYTEGDCL